MKIKRVFADFHHASLLHSLIMLFEDRLGYELYRPIGMDWATQGYWKVYNHPATQEQFLGIGGATPDGTPPLNDVAGVTENQDSVIYHCQDIDSGMTNKAITLDGFMSMDFDIVIASLPHHIEPFKRLCEAHPSKPKLIFQIGNAWTIEAGLAPNIMASAIIHDVPSDINFISYHQEFDTSLFVQGDIKPEKAIYSFVNCFNIEPHFSQDWQLFTKIEKNMPDWEFKAFGGQCRDGAAHGVKQVAEFMQKAMFVWHTKAGGDGYGHILHNAACMGKPMIANVGYYNGKMGEVLLKDGETCIAIDNLDIGQIMSKIEHYSQPDEYTALCEKTKNNFAQNVDFEAEAERIRLFLNNLT
ncbi:MAG: hypothetical protein MOGMAGMI_01797 [Candidatus Omnitrophica bacterium]|nr:hypothetical protein [Candidatus Omnitrophota bacterium]